MYRAGQHSDFSTISVHDRHSPAERNDLQSVGKTACPDAGPRGLLRRLSGELCLGAILLGVCWVEQPVPAVILFGLAGNCIAILGPSLITQATLICPSCTGAASSLMTSASGVGSVVMPVAMGAMAERLSIGLSYLLIAALAFLGSLLAWLVYRTIPQTYFKR